MVSAPMYCGINSYHSKRSKIESFPTSLHYYLSERSGGSAIPQVERISSSEVKELFSFKSIILPGQGQFGTERLLQVRQN